MPTIHLACDNGRVNGLETSHQGEDCLFLGSLLAEVLSWLWTMRSWSTQVGHPTGLRVKFDLSVECAPEAGQVGAPGLTRERGFRRMEANAQPPLPQHRVQAPGGPGPELLFTRDIRERSGSSSEFAFWLWYLWQISAILRDDDLLAQLQCATVVA
jgi:hypothetical protein